MSNIAGICARLFKCWWDQVARQLDGGKFKLTLGHIRRRPMGNNHHSVRRSQIQIGTCVIESCVNGTRGVRGTLRRE